MSDKPFDYTNVVLPRIRRASTPDLYEGERHQYILGICMRPYCAEPRWHHPEKGPLVLCQYHAEEVFSGATRAPPLRNTIDHCSIGRKIVLVELPSETTALNPPKEK